jgi:hypothetical protein
LLLANVSYVPFPNMFCPSLGPRKPLKLALSQDVYARLNLVKAVGQGDKMFGLDNSNDWKEADVKDLNDLRIAPVA